MVLLDLLLIPLVNHVGTRKIALGLGGLFWLMISVFSFYVVAGQAEAYTFESTTGTMEESRFEPRPVSYTHLRAHET